MKSKYADNYRKIRNALRKDTSGQDLREAGFSLDKLTPALPARIFSALSQRALKSVVLPLGQRFFPRLNLFGVFTVVTRYDDVEQLLRAHDAFEVPFGLEMERMTGGVNFALGDDGALHDDQRKRMLTAFESIDIERDLRQPAATITRALLRDAGGKINAASDLVTRVASEVCLSVYGIETEDPDQFAAYSMAGTAQLFADPFGGEVTRKQAMIGSRRLREVLDANIVAYVQHLKGSDKLGSYSVGEKKGVLQKLIDGYATERSGTPEQEDWPLSQRQMDEVRAMMFGLITGFIPTNTMSAGGILEQLHKRPDWLFRAVRLAQKASHDGDPESRQAFTDYIFEVARFNPALAPGQFRVRTKAPLPENARDSVLADIKPGTVVIAATAIAMRDPRKFRAPKTFLINKDKDVLSPPPARNLMFGAGLHDCIGEYWAKAVIAETLGQLLAQPEIKITSKRRQIKRAGPFLSKFMFAYKPKTGHHAQTMITSAIPLREDADIDAARAALSALNDTDHGTTPVPGRLKEKLCDTGVVHFASLNIIDVGEEGAPVFVMLVDFNVDGPAPTALAAINDHAHALLDPLVPYLETDGAARNRRITSHGAHPSFAALALGHMEVFQTRPRNSIGLNFPGTGEFSVAQIEEEQDLYTWLSSQPQFANTPKPLYKTARSDLAVMRAAILSDPALNARFGHLLHRPADRFPKFSRAVPKTFQSFIVSLFTSSIQLYGYAIFVVAALILPALVALTTGILWIAPVGYVTVWWLPALLVMSGALIFAAILWRHENRDEPDTRYASHAHLSAIQEMEDLPGHMQNHLTSVSTLKPGFFRKITMAVSLFAVKKMSELWFRPGFVTDFATIHYAKWFRLKGTEKLIFQAHYDGSWESYLEDFITKVHSGQTAAWNNAVGFPKTRWWILDGAKDGDQFKRWVRRQQVPTLFWFARFPKLTTDVIRTNALVRDGLARARTVSQQATWERLFSAPARPAHAIETEQVQTLLFNGLGRHKMMTARMIAFEDAVLAKAWISEMVSEARNVEEPTLHVAGRLCFGDDQPSNSVRFLSFSAEGLRLLGMPDAPEDGLATMPHAFVDAMARRDRLVGDHLSDTTVPGNWRWRDAQPRVISQEQSAAKGTVHAVVMEYALNDEDLAQMNHSFAEMRTRFALREIDVIFSDTRSPEQQTDGAHPRATDGFGFRDGISQPIMRGTLAFAKGKAEVDNVVDPGEFILGYPDSRGYLPLSPRVSLRHAGAQVLSSINATVIDNVPQFVRHAEDEYRDFGRNGSFMVIRQLKHDEAKFDTFVNYQASQLAPNMRGGRRTTDAPEPDQSRRNDSLMPVEFKDPVTKISVAQDTINSGVMAPMQPRPPSVNEMWWREWVAAKMIGRWADGSSLTRNPSISVTTRRRGQFHEDVRRCLLGLLKHPTLYPLVDNALEAMGVPKEERLIDGAKSRAVDASQPAVLQELLSSPEDRGQPYARATVLWSSSGWTEFTDYITKLGASLHQHDPAAPALPIYNDRGVVPDNDFRHGRDDPEGLYCPFGSHIRRSNPRDSLRPESEVQLKINNRHRLLRRGRTYAQTTDTDEVERGTFFMCFNANIERQFEFVQQTWVNAPSFHGGRHGPDPLVSTKAQGDQYIVAGSANSWLLDLNPPEPDAVEAAFARLRGAHAPKRPSGPQDFSQVVGGGYFFMPGLQALMYLAHSES